MIPSRWNASIENEAKIREELESLGQMYAEAREEIENARESLNTTYFDDDLKIAKEYVDKIWAKYQELLQSLPQDQAGRLKREQHPKMLQLQQELDDLMESVL
jgi:hypothetical protein